MLNEHEDFYQRQFHPYVCVSSTKQGWELALGFSAQAAGSFTSKGAPWQWTLPIKEFATSQHPCSGRVTREMYQQGRRATWRRCNSSLFVLSFIYCLRREKNHVTFLQSSELKWHQVSRDGKPREVGDYTALCKKTSVVARKGHPFVLEI